jgi:hypothetical protein
MRRDKAQHLKLRTMPLACLSSGAGAAVFFAKNLDPGCAKRGSLSHALLLLLLLLLPLPCA